MAKERGEYTSTYHVMLDSPEYERLSLCAASVLHTLRHSTNQTGIVHVFREPLAHRSKVPLDKLQDALRELETEKWIQMDGRWVWIRNHLRFNPHYKPENPKHVQGVLNAVASLPHIDLVDRFLRYYRGLSNDAGHPYLPPDPQQDKHKSRKRKSNGNRNEFESESNEVSNPNQNEFESNHETTTTTTAVTTTTTPADEVFNHWRSVMRHPDAKFTDERKRLIAARFRDGYTVGQLLEAVDGCRASPYHMGENDAGSVFDDLTLICRNGSKVEMFRGRLTTTRTRSNPKAEERKAGMIAMIQGGMNAGRDVGQGDEGPVGQLSAGGSGPGRADHEG